MTVHSNTYTLSNTTATVIAGADNMPHTVTIHNHEKSSNKYVHVGPSDMTLANSIHIDPGETIEVTLRAKDTLYAMSDPTGLVVGVLDIHNQS